MRQLRAWTVLLAVVVLAALLVAGCGKKAQPSATPAPAGSGAQAQAPATSSPTASSTETPAATGSEEPAGSDAMVAKLISNRKGLTSYEMVVNVGGEEQHMLVKLRDGNVEKMKIVTPDRVMYLDSTTNSHYMYDPKTKTALKLPSGQGEGLSDLGKLPTADDLKQEAAKWQSTTLDGVECWTFSSKPPKPGAEDEQAQVWIDKKYGLPRKIKMGTEEVTFSYEKINKVPDSEFELPAGAKVQDMGDMLKNMPQKPGQ